MRHFFAAMQNNYYYLSFLMVATTPVDLLFVELMLHLSHAKQMYSQPMHLSHELMLCLQTSRRRADFNGDFAMKILAGIEF